LLIPYNFFSKKEIQSSSFFEEERTMIRISTAPARPLTDLEEFKRSPDFLILEQVVITSTQLLQKSNQKYDLDSSEGQKICKKYLNLLEKLCDVTDFSLFKTVFSHF